MTLLNLLQIPHVEATTTTSAYPDHSEIPIDLV